jgi:hypothetical protein
MFPVEEVCGGKGLDRQISILLLLFGLPGHNTWGSGLPPQRHLQGSRSLRRGGVLTETG